MPSSTIWRQRPQDIDLSRHSPSPPTEFIEPLSPVLDPSPHLLDRTQPRWNDQSSGNSLQGLGLTYDTPLDDRLDVSPTRDTYVNYDRPAHLANATTTRNGHRYAESGRLRREPVRPHTREGITAKRSRGKGHTRSGSTIDDLASAAIATSPTFTNGSPSQYAVRPATSYEYSQSYTDGERPSKRIRSEKIPSHEWSPKQNGTLGSQGYADPMINEAELLLSLRNGFDFKRSPPMVQKLFPGTSRAQAESTRPEATDVSMTDTIPTPISPRGIRVKTSPSQLRNLFDKRAMPGSPQAPEPEPLTSPPEAVFADVVESLPLPSVEEPQEAVRADLTTEIEIETSKIRMLDDGLSEQQPLDSIPTEEPKRPRRIKPEIQAEVCAKCLQFQREPKTEDGDSISWIKCSPCNRWFHAACAGFTGTRETQTVDKFICSDCGPTHGETTFVRKSSRARTAIDYAGLNQGLIKSSADTTMHHYVQPIKEGKRVFHPDNFARIKPELVTAEYFEKADGMKRPLVVPRSLNPRYGDAEAAEGNAALAELSTDAPATESTSVVESDFIDYEVIDLHQDCLDMVMPRNLTVRKVADLYGPDEHVIVIDVKSQQSHNKWTMSRWADYYESVGDKKVMNVISLEITQSKLGRIIRRPKVVRDIDLQDLVWPDANKTLSYKPVQLYCLMSVADSYTDFHIDFGGSSVYYHILKGKKTFFFIPPEEKNLKKYEDWCNSDSQDETFLGDLTGDCSRVDLSEGDTMFIPAGWIHAVWTPEDSLVIGGNFLTRLDYEMQLKIVEVEKNTKVSPQFRYPFFQKVMWYTLIKYLEEDPIPQDVIDDFNDDEDNVFLRANPVWEEIGEFQNHAEPGQPEYNERYYSKAEISGLPALRDYIYRTALVYIDAPVVPPVTKETAKRMKASIPKNHGEPMDLIKAFAIWIAWKTGNVTAPSWAHPDAVTLQKLAEKREKLSKPEVFRIPPERSSSRVPSIKGGALMTPTKNGPGSVDADSDDGTKRTSSSRPSGLGPKRSACDACRKRRIRCRHREENEGAASIETPRPQSFSNITVEIPKLSMVSAMNGVDTGVSPAEQEYPDFADYLQSNIAQAALATMDMQTVEANGDVSTNPNTSSAKKGRSKACDECRKSKRRCVHDEFGRVDPAKAAEPSKPRGSAHTKRPSLTTDEVRQTQTKKPRLEAHSSEQGQPLQPTDFSALIDPALMADSVNTSAIYQPPAVDMSQSVDPAVTTPVLETNLATESTGATMSNMIAEHAAIDPELTIDPSLDQLTHYAPPLETVVKPEPVALTLEQVSSQTPAASLASPPDSNATDAAISPEMSNGIKISTSIETHGEKTEMSPDDFYTPISTSRHSSRQPKLVDRYIPEDSRPATKPAAKPVTSTSSRRHSSSGASGQTAGMSDKSRRSSSNTSGTTHQIAQQLSNGNGLRSREGSARPGSRGSVLSSEADADEAFARELQAQENGLRRRTSARL